MFIGLLPEYKNNQLELSMMTQAYAQFYDYEDDFSCSQCHNPLCTGSCYGPTSGCSACGSRDCNGSCMDVCSQCGRMGCNGSCTYHCGYCGSTTCGGNCRIPDSCSCCRKSKCVCRKCSECYGVIADSGGRFPGCYNYCYGKTCTTCGKRHCTTHGN